MLGDDLDEAVRFRGSMVGESISKQPERWAEPVVKEEEGGEGGKDLVNMTRHGARKQTVLVDMKNQIGRNEKDLNKGSDDLGVPFGGDENALGSNLILSPHPSVVLPRKGKGAAVITQSLKDKRKFEKSERGFDDRKEKRRVLDERRERRKEREEERRKGKETAEQIKRDLEYKEKERMEEVGEMLKGVDLDGL